MVTFGGVQIMLRCDFVQDKAGFLKADKIKEGIVSCEKAVY